MRKSRKYRIPSNYLHGECPYQPKSRKRKRRKKKIFWHRIYEVAFDEFEDFFRPRHCVSDVVEIQKSMRSDEDVVLLVLTNCSVVVFNKLRKIKLVSIHNSTST